VTAEASERGWRRKHRSDAGESLVELLVSIAIMGIAVLAILGGLAMAATASDQHRDQSMGQHLLRVWAEELSYLGNCGSSVPDPSWKGTAAAAGYAPVSASVDVDYWNGTAFEVNCGGDDAGLQRIKLVIAGPGTLAGGIVLFAVVRDPCEVASC
jgi:Tfp pilus assembly protein PilV